MRYLSLFSGIEAASVAWVPLGWECVAVAEVEPFPCAVLKHHYPDVLNLGDVTKITKEQIEALGHLDVVIGGFPCQDLSVAGKRKGLKHADGTNTRSGLFYIASQIVEWSLARWCVIENVPGLFSSHRGGDFASVVGELAGCGFNIPGDGWRASGVALGPKGLVEWFVLDAQWRGLAQRRNRVFLVRDSGNWTDRPPFFPLTKSLLRNPPPRRETRQSLAPSLAPCIGASGRGFERTGDPRGQDAVIPIQEIGRRQSGNPRNGVGHGQPGDPMFTLQAGAVHGVLCPTLRAGGNQTGGDRPPGTDVDTCESLIPVIVPQAMSSKWSKESSGPAGDEVASMIPVATAMAVRRLTPRECARLQGFPDDFLDIDFRGKPAKDGPKYKALGNSFAVPVVAWIGRRIQQVHDLCPAELSKTGKPSPSA